MTTTEHRWRGDWYLVHSPDDGGWYWQNGNPDSSNYDRQSPLFVDEVDADRWIDRQAGATDATHSV